MELPLKKTQISIKPAKIALALGAIALVLILIGLAGQVTTYLTGQNNRLSILFNVDGEQNIPTGFSVLLLFFSSILLAFITILKRKQEDFSFYWLILSCGFLFMAFDESWQIHEQFSTLGRRLLGGETFGVFFFAWVIPAYILVLILAIFFYRFLARLPVRTRNAFIIAASLYLGGAIGIELFGSYYAELHGMSGLKYSLTYSLITTIEESLEMSGVIIFIWALLKYIANSCKEVRFRFSRG